MAHEQRDVTSSLTHLYRGEMGKMTLYRIRLDTTTNWAIVTSAGLATFALGNPSVRHDVFLFGMFLTWVFLTIESRRFLHYELAHERVRIMERYFYGDLIGEPVPSDWRQQIVDSLQSARSDLGLWEAYGWRLRRNYLWLYLALVLVWLMKLHYAEGAERTLAAMTERAAAGPIPGIVVFGLVGAFYLGLVILTGITTGFRTRPEED